MKMPVSSASIRRISVDKTVILYSTNCHTRNNADILSIYYILESCLHIAVIYWTRGLWLHIETSGAMKRLKRVKSIHSHKNEYAKHHQLRTHTSCWKRRQCVLLESEIPYPYPHVLKLTPCRVKPAAHHVYLLCEDRYILCQDHYPICQDHHLSSIPPRNTLQKPLLNMPSPHTRL